MFENYRNQPLIGDNANANSEEETVLPSSTDLFYFYRQTLVRFAQLSTGKPFLDMCKIFGKWLKVYAEFLLSKIPK